MSDPKNRGHVSASAECLLACAFALAACARTPSAPSTAPTGPAADAAPSTREPEASTPTACTPTVSFASDPMNCGTCGHSCLGGSCTAGVCAPVQVGEPVPLKADWALAIAADASAAYLTTFAVNGPVYRLDGSTGALSTLVASTVESTGPVVSGAQLFFDAQGDALQGTLGVVSVADAAEASYFYDNNAQGPLTYAVDDQNVFWVGSGASTDPLTIYRSPRGSNSQLALTTSPQVSGLALNTQSVFLLSTTGVQSFPKEGASASTPIVAFTCADAGALACTFGGIECDGGGIIADDDSVYWSCSDFTGNSVLATAPAVPGNTGDAGGTGAMIASQPGVFVLDDANVYWVETAPSGGPASATINAYSKATHQTSAFAVATGPVSALAVAPNALWWVVQNGLSDASVYRVAK